MKSKKKTREQVDRELRIFKQVVAVLVQRAGGYVAILNKEFDEGRDDRCEIIATTAGCEIRIVRKIQIATSLN